MTSTALARQSGGVLALADDQTWWTERQVAALTQLGVRNASNGDLVVFMHVAQKTGLDPFARQIYMIERAGKQTIQTGIDGFRLVARRAAERLGETLEYGDTLWCGEDGVWSDVWLGPGAPKAAKATVLRDGKRFTAVALFAEYAQTRGDGSPVAMWAKMPANQLAKCAEALVLRKAYPQDLSGIYTDEEMAQAGRRGGAGQAAEGGDSHERIAALLRQDQGGAQEEEPVVGGSSSDEHDPGAEDTPDPATDPDVVDAEVVDEPQPIDLRSGLARRMFALMGQAGITEDRQHEFLSKALQREITSRKDLTEADVRVVIGGLEEALGETAPPAEDGER